MSYWRGWADTGKWAGRKRVYDGRMPPGQEFELTLTPTPNRDTRMRWNLYANGLHIDEGDAVFVTGARLQGWRAIRRFKRETQKLVSLRNNANRRIRL